MKRFYVLLRKHFWAIPFLPFIITHEISHFILLNISGVKGEFFMGISSLGFRGEFELKNKRQALIFCLAAIAPALIFIPYFIWYHSIFKAVNVWLGLYLGTGSVFLVPSSADFKMALMALKYLFKK